MRGWKCPEKSTEKTPCWTLVIKFWLPKTGTHVLARNPGMSSPGRGLLKSLVGSRSLLRDCGENMLMDGLRNQFREEALVVSSVVQVGPLGGAGGAEDRGYEGEQSIDLIRETVGVQKEKKTKGGFMNSSLGGGSCDKGYTIKSVRNSSVHAKKT